jgi:hypothetical protein
VEAHKNKFINKLIVIVVVGALPHKRKDLVVPENGTLI